MPFLFFLFFFSISIQATLLDHSLSARRCVQPVRPMCSVQQLSADQQTFASKQTHGIATLQSKLKTCFAGAQGLLVLREIFIGFGAGVRPISLALALLTHVGFSCVQMRYVILLSRSTNYSWKYYKPLFKLRLNKWPNITGSKAPKQLFL